MQCGLQTLFEVDGTNVYRESLDVVAQLLLGEPGTHVRLLFLRGTRLFIEANIERQKSSRQVLTPPRATAREFASIRALPSIRSGV